MANRPTDDDLSDAQELLLGDWASELTEEYMNGAFPRQARAIAQVIANHRATLELAVVGLEGKGMTARARERRSFGPGYEQGKAKAYFDAAERIRKLIG